jgi:glycerol-3-phosphate dehydrogenase (NAD(P)+)
VSALGVLGAGSFGTALAVHAARGGRPTVLWARRPEAARELAAARENRIYLAGVPFPGALAATAELARVATLDTVIVAAPSHGFREVLRAFLAVRGPGKATLVSATKGVELASLARMSRVAAEEGARAGAELDFAVLSGPTFAAELARGVPSAAVIASERTELASALQESLAGPTFRLYSSTDVVGVELAGAAKNVIAIAAGVLSGLGLGHNTLAALITRGLHEMTRLAVAYGGDLKTLSGLAGLGDLVLTCTGALSRNRRTGIELAQGKTLAEIEAETTEIAEGIRNSRAIRRLAEERGVEMPIIEQMVEVIYSGKSPKQALRDLMTRELKEESRL